MILNLASVDFSGFNFKCYVLLALKGKKIKNMAQTVCTSIGSTNYLTLIVTPMRASVSLSASREIIVAGEALVCGPFHHPQSHFR
jgi:hypothetical protein